MRSSRHHYEARVLVVPIGQDTRAHLETMKAEGLTGVQVLGDISAIRDVTSRADVVVFLLASLSAYVDDKVALIADLGRDAGNLVAGLTVGVDDPATESERAAMRHLREHVDVLVSVRSPRLGAAFLDVIRGGQRITG